MADGFYALISRMRHIKRWGLMRNSSFENLQEHSHMTAVLAHALAVIRNELFGGSVDCGKVAAAALFHDASEIITGDLPTPVKYYNSEISEAYKKVEQLAADKLLDVLPGELKNAYRDVLVVGDAEISLLIKAADKLSAYIKCVEERKAGNEEFKSAEVQILSALAENKLPEIDYFMKHFMPAFGLTLDELTSQEDV